MINRLIRAFLDMRVPAFMENPRWTPYFLAFSLALYVVVDLLLNR